MSDADSDDYDYDDDEYIDDIPFNEAEDLAAHAIQSPVWVNYDPVWETTSYPSDWEYDSDEYWEQGPSKKRKHSPDRGVSEETVHHANQAKKKRRSMSLRRTSVKSNDKPIAPMPSVIWKSKEQLSKICDTPVVDEDQLERVSLLKDWEERFKSMTKSAPKSMGPMTGQSVEPKSQNGALSEVSESPLSLPVTLREPGNMSSRSELPAEALFELPSDDNEAFDLHSYDESMATTVEAIRQHACSLNDKMPAIDDYHSTDDVELLPTAKNGSRSPYKRKLDALNDDLSSDDLQQPVEALPSSVKKRRLAMPTKQTSLVTTDEASSKVNPEAPIKNDTPEREGAATGALRQTKKRGRPKKQKTIDTDPEKVSGMPNQVIAPKRKRGRPKKEQR